MKVCEVCGEEIDGKDGENLCPVCEDRNEISKKAVRKSRNRKAMDEAMRSIGMVKVRGALGGTYWE